MGAMLSPTGSRNRNRLPSPGFGLTLESLAGCRGLVEVFGEDLDGDCAGEPRVAGTIYFAHAAVIGKASNSTL